MRAIALSGILAAAAMLPSAGTTLRHMSVDELVASSTGIVRGTVRPASSFQRAGMIYTTYRIEVKEAVKGNPGGSLEVAVPGGDYQGLHQDIAGAPAFRAGAEYVVFYWTGPSGTNYIVGMCQGLFEVHTDASGEVVLKRRAVSSEVFGASGSKPDHGLTLRWRDLGGGAAKQDKAQ